MNRENLYEADDDDDDDDISLDLEELRRACMVPDANSASFGGGGRKIPSDSENEDDFEMLQSIKSQLASSTDPNPNPMDLSMPSDSESEDDFEMLRSIKSQLALPMGDDDDGAFETLRAIRKRFSSYENSDMEGCFMNDSPTKNKQVHASDNEHSREILSRTNTCESFPDAEEVEAVDLHEKTFIEPLDHHLVSSASSSFPESAEAFVVAIRKNRSNQELLRRKLGEIEATIKQKEMHKKNVMIVKDFQASCKRITKQALSQRKDPRVELISARKPGPPDSSSKGNDKKTSPLMFGPPENPCVANYRMALEKHPVSVDRKSWTNKEKENLAKGLKQQYQDTLIRQACQQSSDSAGSTDDIDTILELTKNREITPEKIREFLPKVNWSQLDIKNRSAAECEARWTSSEDPFINHGPWTPEEDDRLRRSIMQNKSLTDWLGIAKSLEPEKSLGTDRTPFQCLARYQRSLNPVMLGREWTAEEDDQLSAAVDLFGEKHWQDVASVLIGRTGPQCSDRWRKSLHHTKATEGKWSSEEEKRLKVAVALFGTKS